VGGARWSPERRQVAPRPAHAAPRPGGMTIKIGWALNVAERLATLQTASPQKLLVLGVLRGTIEQERLAHRLFAVHRLLGEWFAPGEDLMRFIADHAQDWSGEGATEIFDAAEANV